jgi:hypothetical protein
LSPGRVAFVVDKVALRQVFPEYFGFPCQFSFQRLLHTHLSSGAGRIGQLVADVPSGFSLTPPQEKLQHDRMSSGLFPGVVYRALLTAQVI